MAEVALAQCGGNYTYRVPEFLESRWHSKPSDAQEEIMLQLVTASVDLIDCSDGSCENNQVCLSTFEVAAAIDIIKTKGQLSVRSGRLRFRSSVERGAIFKLRCECGDDEV